MSNTNHASNFWEEKYAHTVSEEEARMAGEALIGYFELLIEWKAKEVARGAQQQGG